MTALNLHFSLVLFSLSKVVKYMPSGFLSDGPSCDGLYQIMFIFLNIVSLRRICTEQLIFVEHFLHAQCILHPLHTLTYLLNSATLMRKAMATSPFYKGPWGTQALNDLLRSHSQPAAEPAFQPWQAVPLNHCILRPLTAQGNAKLEKPAEQLLVSVTEGGWRI